MAPSPELTAYNTDADAATAACAKAINDAFKLPTDKERDDAIDAAKKKLDEDLKKADEKYKKARAAAVIKFKELLNVQVKKFREKKETNMKPVNALLPSVSEAKAYSPYDPSKKCDKKDSGNCTPSTDVKDVYHCDEGGCKCKCHVYVKIGELTLLATEVIHTATFQTCPNLDGLFGSGSMQCICEKG
jgi:hypothetical protein